jgi:5-methylcytosine-specific restriction endonuclease McrA
MHLSPDAAIRALDKADLEEKSSVVEVVSLIAVIDKRQDYLDAGYSCMRNYCMSRLHMSKDKASRRIQVARAAELHPEIYECLADGRLSVTTASVVAPHLTPESAERLLAAAAFKPKHEIESMLAAAARSAVQTPTTSAIEPTPACSGVANAPAHVTSLADLCAPAPEAAGPGELAPAHVINARRGRVTPSAIGLHDVRLSITGEEHEDFCAAQALLGHAVPSGDPAEIYARAMKFYRAHLEKQRLGCKPGAAVRAASPGSRNIPKQLRRLVWERDGGRCAYVSADGHRCGETFRLELDHITPLAKGGTSTPENLRVLCRAHNQHEAERVLGRERMEHRREVARRERARDKVAAAADVERAKAREAAMEARRTALQARRDDLHGALRGLGFRDCEAKRGVALADATPEASLEACLRRVLPELARPVALRGERMARSTA